MSKYVIVDVETTGLNYDIHRPFEISWLTVDMKRPIDAGESPMTFFNALSSKEIRDADNKALEVNGYTREMLNEHLPGLARSTVRQREMFYDDIHGATLVGANVRFDARMLMSIMPHSEEPWHHRLFDIQSYYAGTRRYTDLVSLSDIVSELTSEGYSITVPDHSSRNDVRAVRDILAALW